jgi:hypothetical protein
MTRNRESGTMSITIDHEMLSADDLGLTTIGHVLSHVHTCNRLVVNLLIDGEEPDLERMGEVRRVPLNGHTLFIETAEPREMALDVLEEVEQQLDEADRLKGEAVDLLQRNAAVRAMERLSGCFSTWHHAQESLTKTAQLLRIDLSRITIEGQTLQVVLGEFCGQLREVKQAMENRDFVTLADVLTYEMTATSRHWRDAIVAMRGVIAA